ncbi:MAG: hypothetical protein Q4D45_04230 [Lachnospiraceae bacterium]|nr:hypothetical protein [Lachnospiraceae bacterium]
MFFKEDHTYDIIRDRSVQQWLEEMSSHEDLAVRGGVKVTQDYINDLKKQIERLKETNELKNQYLKQLKNR